MARLKKVELQNCESALLETVVVSAVRYIKHLVVINKFLIKLKLNCLNVL